MTWCRVPGRVRWGETRTRRQAADGRGVGSWSGTGRAPGHRRSRAGTGLVAGRTRFGDLPAGLPRASTKQGSCSQHQHHGARHVVTLGSDRRTEVRLVAHHHVGLPGADDVVQSLSVSSRATPGKALGEVALVLAAIGGFQGREVAGLVRYRRGRWRVGRDRLDPKGPDEGSLPSRPADCHVMACNCGGPRYRKQRLKVTAAADEGEQEARRCTPPHLKAGPNQRARWSSRSCWSSPIQATWPSGRSRTPGTSSAAAGVREVVDPVRPAADGQAFGAVQQQAAAAMQQVVEVALLHVDVAQAAAEQVGARRRSRSGCRSR